MTQTIRIGMLGCGTVGGGVLRLLRENASILSARLGGPIEVRRVAVRDLGKARDTELPKELFCTDPLAVIDDPEIDVVVEVIGGVSPAGELVRRAIERGKSVVTANKALLAEDGHALIELAEKKGVDLYFEAAVCGGIPIIRVLREALASDRIVALRGIVNGTSNYILSRMHNEGIGFPEALKAAQEAGYAEADPSLDVDGGDAAHKLTILSTLAFGARIRPEKVTASGLRAIGALDIHFAKRFGYVIKPLSIARAGKDGSLELRVHPALVEEQSVLASVGGALNAVYLEGVALGPCLLSGYGAGAMPTAVSVVSDVVDVGRNVRIGSRGRVPQRAFHGEHLVERAVRDPGEHVGRWYLRFMVLDRPGVLARITGVLGGHDVSIEQMVQDGRAVGTNAAVSVVVVTHPARESDVRSAIAEIDALPNIAEPTRALHIEEG